MKHLSGLARHPQTDNLDAIRFERDARQWGEPLALRLGEAEDVDGAAFTAAWFPPVSAALGERVMGGEPTTFCFGNLFTQFPPFPISVRNVVELPMKSMKIDSLITA